jgi:hypothetical protein
LAALNGNVRDMSTTAVGETRETTLPAEVFEAAKLKPGDKIEWRFELGEIRGRRLPNESAPLHMGRLVERGGALVVETLGFTIDPDEIANTVREERQSR